MQLSKSNEVMIMTQEQANLLKELKEIENSLSNITFNLSGIAAVISPINKSEYFKDYEEITDLHVQSIKRVRALQIKLKFNV